MSHKETLKLFCIKKADRLREVNSGKIGKMKHTACCSHAGHDLLRFNRVFIRYAFFTRTADNIKLSLNHRTFF